MTRAVTDLEARSAEVAAQRARHGADLEAARAQLRALGADGPMWPAATGDAALPTATFRVTAAPATSTDTAAAPEAVAGRSFPSWWSEETFRKGGVHAKAEAP